MNGLNLDKAKQYTLHPIRYVQQYLNWSPTGEPTPTEPTPVEPTPTEPTPVEPTPVEPTPTEPVQPVEPPAVEPVILAENPDQKAELFDFVMTSQEVAMVNNGIPITVADPSNQLAQLSNDAEIDVELSGVGTLVKRSFLKTDFNRGTIKVVVRSAQAGDSIVRVGKSYHKVTFVDGINPVARLSVEHDGYFQTSVPETVKIVALDGDGKRAPVVSFGGSIAVGFLQGSGMLEPASLEPSDFVNGVATVRVTIADGSTPVRLRAHGGALVGESELLAMEPKAIFSDIDYNHPHYAAIKYLKEHNIIAGYSDGTFKPSQTVNRVEALKMLMLAFNVSVSDTVPVSFADTESGAWYLPTLSSALQHDIVKGYPDGTFKPAQIVNKAEYLKILFRTNQMTPTKEVAISPYVDVPIGEWYTGYAFMANQMNLLDDADHLYPENGMTRAGVAETIFRLKMIQENGLVAYDRP
ncbi:S-layer homology domain-containing protein [Candidatus Peregrinibacteria bacterium]|nr:MAG: S-layer homology domain-containing protein [Candidatus Peregrinibacteria bacterium]